MIKYIGTLLILIGLLSVGCQNPQEKLRLEVMEIHDEMMPLIRKKIRPTQEKLTLMIKDAEQKMDSSSVNKYKIAYHQLDLADKAMHDWMNQFKTPTIEMPKEEAMKYLEDQKIKVTKMKEVMEINMKAAREVIEF